MKHKALMMATSSDVKTDAWSGRVKDRVVWPSEKAHPTPSTDLEPSVNTLVYPS